MYAAPVGEELKLSPPKSAPDRKGRLLNKGVPLIPGRWVLEWRREGEDPVRREVEVKPEAITEVAF